MIPFHRLAALPAVLILVACQSPDVQPARFAAPDLSVTRVSGPPDAAPGTCWGVDETPAVIESVTDRVEIQPAQLTPEGRVLAPPIYKPETTRRIVEDRTELWFETPCPEDLTDDRVAALQRALAARGVYSGDITGVMDRATRGAVRAYQRPQGLNSDILSRAAAERLGLISAAEFEAAREARAAGHPPN